MASILLALGLVLLPAGYAAAVEKACAKMVTVTDGGDSGEEGQLRTAIAQVCQGGKVEVASSVSAISLAGTITVDKNVKVSGTGQTIDCGGVGLEVSVTGHLRLNGFILTGPSSQSGITVEGELTLKGVTVTQFWSSGIWAKPGSFVTLNRGTVITGNMSMYRSEGGCGIYNDGGTVELFDDAAVIDNMGWACFSPSLGAPSAFGFGGGIFSKNGGSITLNDQAIVSGNYFHYCDPTKCRDGQFCPTGNGGGISSIGGTVTLNGSAQVSGNWAASGGGIDLQYGASLTLNDNATVTGNYAYNGGGGVRVYTGSRLTLNGAATIIGNTAENNGGGVFNVSSVVTLNETAGITGNTAGSKGGGVFSSWLGGTWPLPVLEVNDSAFITGNAPNDIYMY